jgi:uncharacterized membrane protein
MQCPVCHNENTPQSAFCVHCGASLSAAAQPQASSPPPPAISDIPPAPAPASGYPAPPASTGPGLSPNAAAALSYVTLIPAIFFLAIDPYNKMPLVRFHAYQSVGLSIVWVAAWFCIDALEMMIGFGTFARLIWLIQGVVFFALFIVWVFVILKALKGEWFKLPVLGDFALKQAQS